MTYCAGLDVSLRSTHVCVIDADGELLAEGKTDSEVADIVAFLDELDVGINEVGLEAGTLTQYLTYGLQFAGYEVVCMEARQVKAALSHALLPMLDARLVLYHSFRELDNRTCHRANDDPVCRRLMTAPGVGFITALTFKSGVDDPTRFKRSRTVAAHFGLTPRRFQSGEIDFHGHISRAGDAGVRSTLYVAANAMMTRSSKWSPLKAWGMKLVVRCNIFILDHAVYR